MKKTLLLLTPLFLITLPTLAAPLCTQQTTRGYWGYTCEGELPVGVPVRILGTCTSSRAAHWECSGTVNDGGVILEQLLVGDAFNNPNCTGQISYTQTLGGTTLPVPLDINYVILDHGDTIQGLPTNSGGVLSCSLKRISMPAE
jgi:hypothetical protein